MTDAQTDGLATGDVYVDGVFTPAAEARVSPFDRAYLFGDAVYEVVSVLDGKLVDFDAHLARLARSLGAISIPPPNTDAEILDICRALVARGALREGFVYLQVSRGAAPRDFGWPEKPRPTLFAFAQSKALIDAPSAAGIKVALVEDIRWRRRDVKTVNLLGASWAKAEAAARGADDAWMTQADADGVERVTEGSSNNAYIVDAAGRIMTRPLSRDILHGVTRAALAAIAQADGVDMIEQAFTPDAARGAREAFITSATMLVTPVIAIDGAPIGDGRAGPVARRLREIYIAEARRTAI